MEFKSSHVDHIQGAISKTQLYPVFVIPSKRQKVETEKNEETQNVLAIRKPMSTGVNFLCIPYIFDESNFVLDAWLSRLFLNT